MKISILDIDRLIKVNNLKEVTATKIFSNKMMYDPEGLLSYDIFGMSIGDRRTTFAYIDLKRHFIHPHIYQKVLKTVFRNIVYIINGQRRYSISNGKLIEDEDGWTGIDSLYDHWDEIDWSKTKLTSSKESEQINSDLDEDGAVSLSDNQKLLKNLSKKEIFLNKFLVCPPAYRDIMIAGTIDSSDHVNELNNLYLQLLRSVSLLAEGGLFSRTQYQSQLKIQESMVDIYNYFKNQISKKQGLIRKHLLGKNVDYGSRAVISGPSYNFERIEDNIIDSEHCALPISLCISNFYPFIEAWLKNFFTREIVNDPNIVTFYDPILKHEITATLKDPESEFAEKKIKKMINDYALNPDNRFKVITVKVDVPTAKGTETKEAVMMLKGKIILENNATKVLNRPMTITDILYLACTEICEKRHVMISRYPVGTDKGIFFNKIRVQSTKNHIKLIFNGTEYPFYPDIKLDTDISKVGVQFIDTLVYSNSHLDGLGE